MDQGNEVRIFLCYAHMDSPRIENYYRQLIAAGYKPWMDSKDILPGQDWSML